LLLNSEHTSISTLYKVVVMATPFTSGPTAQYQREDCPAQRLRQLRPDARDAGRRSAGFRAIQRRLVLMEDNGCAYAGRKGNQPETPPWAKSIRNSPAAKRIGAGVRCSRAGVTDTR